MSHVSQQSHLNYSIVESGLLQFDRIEAFKLLRAGLKLYKPDAKLLYAWVGPGMSPADLLIMTSNIRNPDAEATGKIDYLLVYSYLRKYPNGSTEMMYWVECPMLFSPKSLNTFMYYKKKNQVQEFFADYMQSTIKIKPEIFNDYLNQVMHLSHRKKIKNRDTGELVDDPNYWKLPENSKKVVKGITDMCAMYNEKV